MLECNTHTTEVDSKRAPERDWYPEVLEPVSFWYALQALLARLGRANFIHHSGEVSATLPGCIVPRRADALNKQGTPAGSLGSMRAGRRGPNSDVGIRALADTLRHRSEP